MSQTPGFWDELTALVARSAVLAVKCVLFERAGPGGYVELDPIKVEIEAVIDMVNAAVERVRGNRRRGTEMTLADARLCVAAAHRSLAEYLENRGEGDGPEKE